MDKVSVIIPCYNVESYVAECLNSVLNQTHKNIEIICVDDGSKDRTLAILNEYQQKYPTLIKVIPVKNAGASAARNTGFKLAEGDYIQFLDSDDIITKDKFEKQLKGFSSDVDVVVSDREEKNNDLTKVLNTYYFNDIEENPLQTAVKRVITTCNPLYKKNVVAQLNGYDETLNSAQDWDFHLRLVLANYKIKYISGVYFINRKVQGSVSSNWIKVGIQATDVVLKLKSDLLKSNSMNVDIKQYLARINLNSAIFCKEEKKSQLYLGEIKFWAEGHYKFINSKFKRVFVFLFGLDRLVFIEKKIKGVK